MTNIIVNFRPEANLPKMIHPTHCTHTLSGITNTLYIETCADTEYISLKFEVATLVVLITTACTLNFINNNVYSAIKF
jgi:hypothetical protein